MRGALAALVVFLALVAAEPAAARLEFFRMPSGNIGCVYSTGPALLRCDVQSGLKPKPPRAPSCPGDIEWGYGYRLGKTGRARGVCAGDTAVDPDAKVLRYGRTWSRGGFSCTSRRSGLRCRNRSGHGFFLSREHSYTF